MKTFSSISIERYIAIGFAGLIFCGGCVLAGCNLLAGMDLAFVDALFMSASAICVTGLATVSFGTDLCGAAQVALVVLIQVGGVGVLTAAAWMMLAAGRRLGFRDRLLVSGGLGVSSPQGVVRLLRHTFMYILFFEAAGAALMFLSLVNNGFPVVRAARHAACLAVSAFCNAGFALFPNNLEWFTDMYVVPGVVMALIVIGGIGFPVMLEVQDYVRGRRPFLSLHSKTALIATAALVVGGAVALYFAEREHAFAGMSGVNQAINAFFGSITARTAGFDTVPYTKWSQTGLLITLFLMAVGACPSSTGGGLKTTAVVILLWFAWTEMRQKDSAAYFGRSISAGMLRKAAAVALVYVLVIATAVLLLTIIEDQPAFLLAFEAVSALSTVGLTVDVTPHLTTAGKIIIILLMYFGRVGLLTLAASLVPAERDSGVLLPEADILI